MNIVKSLLSDKSSRILLMTTDDRPWEKGPAIKASYNAVYNHENNEYFHVGQAVADILKCPENFEFRILPISEDLKKQISGQGNIDVNYVQTISGDDLWRPILMIRHPDRTVRIIDGYHRASAAISHGAPCLAAWILTTEQTNKYKLNPKRARMIIDKV